MVGTQPPPSPNISLLAFNKPKKQHIEEPSISWEQVEDSQPYGASVIQDYPVIKNDPIRDHLLEAVSSQYRDGPDRLKTTAKHNNRFGVYLISILAISTVVLRAGLSFLLFLWLAPTNNHQWRSIILAGWATDRTCNSVGYFCSSHGHHIDARSYPVGKGRSGFSQRGCSFHSQIQELWPGNFSPYILR